MTLDRTVPGGAVLHPIFVACVVLLVANDHWLKGAYPGLLTGKLSDFAGVCLFPVALVAACEMASAGMGRPEFAAARIPALVAVVCTGIVFSLVKTTPPGADAYEVAWGVARWALDCVTAALHGRLGGADYHRVSIVRDGTDLWALTTLPLGYVVATRGRAHTPSLPTVAHDTRIA